MDMKQRDNMIAQLKAACPGWGDMSNLYFSGDGVEASKKLEKAMKAYAQIQSDELPLVCLGSELEGFVLTTKRIYVKDNENKTGVALPEEIVDVHESKIKNTLWQTMIPHVLIFMPQHAKPCIITTPDKEETIKLLCAWKQIAMPASVKENLVESFTRSAGEWGFETRWILTGRRFAEVYANQDMISVKQYKQFIFTFGKQESSVNLQDVTSVIREKKIAKSSIYLIILGLVGLFIILGIIPLLIGLFTLREKSLKLTFSNGSISIPDMPVDEQMEDLLNYIRERKPNIVRV